MAGSYKQGYYKLTHPEKYRGDISKVRFMSSWELNTHKFLDNNPNVLRWSSEEIAIPYIKPTDGKIHKYYPDYWVMYQNKNGEVIEEIWEVKPSSQVTPSRRGKRPKQQLLESVTHAINLAKWRSAQLYCQKHGYTFRILTEKQLFR